MWKSKGQSKGDVDEGPIMSSGEGGGNESKQQEGQMASAPMNET